MSKLIIFSAPSGSGKSTIINYLLKQNLNLAFSISATSRPPRGTEQNGVEYFFLSPEEFRQRIANDEFLEYEEVYKDRFYGTLKSQVEKQLEARQNVIFDVDVVGGCNIKRFYGNRALSVFIQPPSIEELRKRLTGRGTDSAEVIESRIAKAQFELAYADKFDVRTPACVKGGRKKAGKMIMDHPPGTERRHLPAAGPDGRPVSDGRSQATGTWPPVTPCPWWQSSPRPWRPWRRASPHRRRPRSRPRRS